MAARPTYSYFSGVSDGGHEALVLAQRYPADFDGIIAGAPANNWAPLVGLVAPWVAAANLNAQGGQILTAEKLPALHAAVMAACADPNGVIRDPRACAFDPASMRCPAGLDQPSCLTDAQIRVVRDEYRGPYGQGWSWPVRRRRALRLRTGLGQLAGHAGGGRRGAR